MNPPARDLVGIQIFPRNRFYQVVSGSPKKAEQYYCLAFYSDNTSEDVTDQVVWTLQNDDDAGSPVDPNLATLAGMGGVDAGYFVGDTPRNDTQLRITASLGTDSRENDTVLLELSNGVTDPDPNGV